MSELKGLSISVKPLVDHDFRRGSREQIDVAPYIENLRWNREMRLAPLRQVINHAMEENRENPEKSDAWLAPRVHATVRLTRREAADRRVWNYLAVVAIPEYVRWRYKNETSGVLQPVPIVRFLGDESRNAIARLWWGAELTRNGPDYRPTCEALKTVRFSTTWQVLDAIHHRPAALAVIRFVNEWNDGQGVTDTQQQVLAKAFNLRLTTLSLDSVCPNPPVDAPKIREWIRQDYDENEYLGKLPMGPEERRVPDEDVQKVYGVLKDLADELRLAPRGLPRSQISKTARQ